MTHYKILKEDQQHFWSNDGASIFLKVFSPKNSWVAIAENKPQGLYFSKAFFEGLTFGGAYTVKTRV